MNMEQQDLLGQVQLTVFVVDDDEAIRSSQTRALGQRGYRVVTHPSAEDFLAAYKGVPGCLVLDYGMPGMDGLTLQAHLKRAGISIPVIFITGHGGVPQSVQAIKAGAIDFLEKPFRQQVLVERIETAFEQVRQGLEKSVKSAQQKARIDRLTARELEIVHGIMVNPAETSSKEIAAKLGISPRTVDHHRARILEKLDVKSVAEMIALMHEV